MAFDIKNFGSVDVGMGGIPSIWSYRSKDDLIDTINSPNYFNGISVDLETAVIKSGDMINVVDSTNSLSILSVTITGQTITTALIAPGTGGGSVTSVGAIQPPRGIQITGSPITTAGDLKFTLANDLNAIENMTGIGFGVRTAGDTWNTRVINGLAGNISVKDGDGVATNPQISIDPTYIGQGSITTVGTITAGTWTGDTIKIANGGTGQTTAQLAINALTDVAAATNEFVLTKDTATGDAIWKVNDGAGTVTSVDVSGGTTGLTTSGGPITTSGTITLSGTLAVANGGTGGTTAQTAINNITGASGATIGHVLTVNSDNNAEFNAIPGKISANIYMFGNATATTIATQNVYVKVAGTTIDNDSDAGFTLADNRITNTSGVQKKVYLSAVCCGRTTANNITFIMKIYKNGVAFDPIQACTDWNVANNLNEVSCAGKITLANNDYVEIWFANTDGTQDPTVDTLSMYVQEID